MAKDMQFRLPTNGLFSTEEQRQTMAALENRELRVIELVALQDFKNHPFKIREGQEMYRLIESTRQMGVLNPLLVRPAPNQMYEVLSGHERKYAAEVNEIDRVPCVVFYNISDEDATIIMSDSNIQREELLPSERAYAYQMKAEAMRRKLRQHDENDERLGRVTNNIDEKESARTVEAYMRLTHLIRELLDLVDSKNIPVYAGVDLSFLSEDDQRAVYNWLVANRTKPKVNLQQAASLRRNSETGVTLDDYLIGKIMEGWEKPKPEKVSISYTDLAPMLPEITLPHNSKEAQKTIRDYIIRAVTFYRANHPELMFAVKAADDADSEEEFAHLHVSTSDD